MPIDYSKWDAIQDTDEEAESHPSSGLARTAALSQAVQNPPLDPGFGCIMLNCGPVIAELTYGAEPVLHVMAPFAQLALERVCKGYCFYYKCANQADPEFTCGGCGLIPYCSQECQRADWDEWHKDTCAHARGIKHGFVGVVSLEEGVIISDSTTAQDLLHMPCNPRTFFFRPGTCWGEAMEAVGMQHGDNIFVEGLDNSFLGAETSSAAHRMQPLSECVHPCKLIVVGLTDHGGAAAPSVPVPMHAAPIR